MQVGQLPTRLGHHRLPRLTGLAPQPLRRPDSAAFLRDGALGEHRLLGLGDGRVTAEHLSMLRTLAAEQPGFEWFTIDTPVPAAGPPRGRQCRLLHAGHRALLPGL